MSGYDKIRLMDWLKERGWKEAEGIEGYYLTPPDNLWKNRPKWFYVYDARELEYLLGDEPEDEPA